MHTDKNKTSYRAFRSNWTGTPSEEPALVAFASHHQSILDIYVSWNGDTETTLWRFYDASSEKGDLRLLGEVTRQGFETHEKFGVNGNMELTHVVAEAFDQYGNLIRQTKPVRVGSYEQKTIAATLSFSQDPMYGELDLK